MFFCRFFVQHRGHFKKDSIHIYKKEMTTCTMILSRRCHLKKYFVFLFFKNTAFWGVKNNFVNKIKGVSKK